MENDGILQAVFLKRARGMRAFAQIHIANYIIEDAGQQKTVSIMKKKHASSKINHIINVTK